MQEAPSGERAPVPARDGTSRLGEDVAHLREPEEEVREVRDLQRDLPARAIDRPEYEAWLDTEPFDLRASLVAMLESRRRRPADRESSDFRALLGSAPRAAQPVAATALKIDVIADAFKRRRVEQRLEAILALEKERGGDLADERGGLQQVLEAR
jgi:hypothetical protein